MASGWTTDTAAKDVIKHDGDGRVTISLPAVQTGLIVQVRGATASLSPKLVNAAATPIASSGDCGALYHLGDGSAVLDAQEIYMSLESNAEDAEVSIFVAYGPGYGKLTYFEQSVTLPATVDAGEDVAAAPGSATAAAATSVAVALAAVAALLN